MIPPTDPVIPPTANEPDMPTVRPPKAAATRVKRPKDQRWVRIVLLLTAAGFVVVLGLSLWINPYDADGQPRTMATHRQLGLPPCNFMVMAGKPCPSCGMTTAFSLLAHGDVANSLKANWVGTLLAVYWLALIPWAIVSAIKGRPLGVRSGEFLITCSIVGFMVLAMGRWVWVIFR